ncbi:MAG: aminotransferase class I/II-fold pyridoxal phosphate-dependent enzyme [Hyphomicrobiales bacterium]|nr:aminotransferase class I/II-fold pyridoxal phosphate-dependent enzyme [Hyphomicrobiales bacterium]
MRRRSRSRFGLCRKDLFEKRPLVRGCSVQEDPECRQKRGNGLVRRLTEADRQLLDRVVRARSGLTEGPQSSSARPDRASDRSRRLDFATLPGYAEQQMLRSAAAGLGLRDPYFLVHDADAGATTTIDNRPLINFSSYDYLGFNHCPAVRSAAQSAVDRYGVSASASRLVAGERPIHGALEKALANHYLQEGSLTYVSGHAANVATIAALLGPRDLMLHDALAHNSIVMGAVMARCERRAFPHNDMGALDAALAAIRGQYDRVLIVAEGLYSMDGDICDLPALIEIKDRREAWLMIDDAHGLGVLGPTGQGVFEHFGVDPKRVDIWMGTLSKTLAACGGFIAGPNTLVDYLKGAAGGFVYSVAMPPAIAAAALTALGLLGSEPERVVRLKANSRRFNEAARAAGLDIGLSVGEAIAPVVTGSSLRAVALSQRLFDRGVNVQPIIHPAIPERLARLRFFISSEHNFEQIDAAIRLLAEQPRELRLTVSSASARADMR